ncbi:tRNA adenosine deaminase-associated protein [Segniliparus rugosus]|uniref:tRNA adenosine deaminase-associated protein n=1 Tax=Segniliparus rugosus (strain ATCC BAA-974 / DSM 45345 / CCUG 50838 / CIP 108380 / JCM 13579 / CDC 945) TaxID=679197 RepID=E5XR64_SEGRC|nr:tRNA adenosine deaminase-associated protein [Segniliparus rugosus]EFV13157.1 hypothetical protein HMPREF9336_01986 [Segniliparus rugosus ATCC BAA-974]
MSSQEAHGLVGVGVAVLREEGHWRVLELSPKVLASLEQAERELRELRSTSAVFGLINVDDEFFVIVRPGPGGSRLLLSDATAALDYDLAADVLDELHVEIPDPDELDDDEEPWAEGDFAILEDLGLSESVLSLIVSESDELYADEQITALARQLGFEEELADLERKSKGADKRPRA